MFFLNNFDARAAARGSIVPLYLVTWLVGSKTVPLTLFDTDDAEPMISYRLAGLTPSRVPRKVIGPDRCRREIQSAIQSMGNAPPAWPTVFFDRDIIKKSPALSCVGGTPIAIVWLSVGDEMSQ
jgi:hypothetical protein